MNGYDFVHLLHLTHFIFYTTYIILKKYLKEEKKRTVHKNYLKKKKRYLEILTFFVRQILTKTKIFGDIFSANTHL